MFSLFLVESLLVEVFTYHNRMNNRLDLSVALLILFLFCLSLGVAFVGMSELFHCYYLRLVGLLLLVLQAVFLLTGVYFAYTEKDPTYHHE